MAELSRRCRPLLGTFVEVTADRDDAIEAAFAAVERVHCLMSAHEPDSDVSRINRFGHLRPIEVHNWTGRVIERALFWSKQSEGAFDVVRAGKEALERGLILRHADQPRPEAAHWTWLEIQGASVRLLKPGCIDLGGIAKGFAVDRAVDALREAGCDRGLVNAGGDLRGFGPAPWPVTVVDPLTRTPIAAIEIDDEALATSAGLPGEDSRLTFDHLGGANSRWLSISVMALKACDADALTKIVWARGANAAPLLGESGAKALAFTAAGDVETVGELAEAAA
jgi:thiamine biosynthesis lipoprotein